MADYTTEKARRKTYNELMPAIRESGTSWYDAEFALRILQEAEKEEPGTLWKIAIKHGRRPEEIPSGPSLTEGLTK